MERAGLGRVHGLCPKPVRFLAFEISVFTHSLSMLWGESMRVYDLGSPVPEGAVFCGSVLGPPGSENRQLAFQKVICRNVLAFSRNGLLDRTFTGPDNGRTPRSPGRSRL